MSEDDQRILAAVPISLVTSSTGATLRVLCSVKHEEDPSSLHYKNLLRQLTDQVHVVAKGRVTSHVSQGYPEQHAARALAKANNDAEQAAQWLKVALTALMYCIADCASRTIRRG